MIDFYTFMEKYKDTMKSPYIDVHTWHLYQKNLWIYLQTVSESEVKNIDVSYFPLYVRWNLSTKFPDLLKYLLIDTTTFEIPLPGGSQYRIILDRPDLYLKRHLIPLMYQQYNPEMIRILKKYMRGTFDYWIH